jgi:hypothetical protein
MLIDSRGAARPISDKARADQSSILEAADSAVVSWRSPVIGRGERTIMTETSTPDPAQNKPSQAEGGPEDQDVESAVDPAGNKPSQAEGAPEDQNVDLPGGPVQDKPTGPEEGAGI